MVVGARIGLDPRPTGAPRGVEPSPALERLHEAIERGVDYLLSIQAPEGYWVGELEADTTLESDYIFYLNVLGKADPLRVSKLANYVQQRQLSDGGWNIYEGGPSELNATIKAYVALKLAGHSSDAPHMRQARERVHALGGFEHANSYTRFYLALVGAVEWDVVPAVPPELMLLPNWFLSRSCTRASPNGSSTGPSASRNSSAIPKINPRRWPGAIACLAGAISFWRSIAPTSFTNACPGSLYRSAPCVKPTPGFSSTSNAAMASARFTRP